MKKILLIAASAFIATGAFSQGQIGNSDMELWESVSSGEEPVNWNSFMTATGSLNGMADVQVEQSADIRPGSTGSTSARIWSRDAGFSIIANGNLTCGRVNMGSISPSNQANHNYSQTADPDFSEALTDTPDSIVFWVKFNLGGGTNGNARMKATLHDNFDYNDPEDGASGAHVVAQAVVNFPPTGWTRMSVPFDYSGPASGNTFILVTFTTNETAAAGNIGDEVFVDDVELIYNGGGAGIEENPDNALIVAMNNEANQIVFKSEENLDGRFAVYNAMGQIVRSGELEPTVDFEAKPGVYFVHAVLNGVNYKFEILKN